MISMIFSARGLPRGPSIRCTLLSGFFIFFANCRTTFDQFFDEAQWESYRKLGAWTGDRLFN